MMPIFKMLAPLRILRGTALDPFGLTDERRLERQDILQYQDMLTEICRGLTAENYTTAVELAGLPKKLRGFGHVKARNRDALLKNRAMLLNQFRGGLAHIAIIDADRAA